MIWGELVSPVTLTSSAWSSGVLCQIDLFERHAPLAKQRLRVDAEGAGVGGEENDMARHVDEYQRLVQYPGRPGVMGARRAWAVSMISALSMPCR